MMFPAATASFLLAALLIELTPGPNMTYLALISARDGWLAGAATVAGIALGLGTIGALAALGVAELIHSSAAAYEVLQWAGVLFLLYLAWEGWVGASDGGVHAENRVASHFMKGLLTNLLNPKAAVFYVSVLPTFIDGTAQASRQALVLTAIYVAVATTVHGAIVVLAGTVEPYLNDAKRERLARRVLSALLAVVAIWFGISTNR